MTNYRIDKVAEDQLKDICQKLHDHCVEYNIPYIATFCLGMDEDGVLGSTSVYFTGPDTTPDIFVEVAELLEDGAAYEGESEYHDIGVDGPKLH